MSSSHRYSKRDARRNFARFVNVRSAVPDFRKAHTIRDSAALLVAGTSRALQWVQ